MNSTFVKVLFQNCYTIFLPFVLIKYLITMLYISLYTFIYANFPEPFTRNLSIY